MIMVVSVGGAWLVQLKYKRRSRERLIIIGTRRIERNILIIRRLLFSSTKPPEAAGRDEEAAA